MKLNIGDCKIKDIMKEAERVYFRDKDTVVISWKCKNDFVFEETYKMDNKITYNGESTAIEKTFGDMTLRQVSEFTTFVREIDDKACSIQINLDYTNKGYDDMDRCVYDQELIFVGDRLE